MINEPVLLQDWHPVASMAQLATQPLLGVRLLGEDLVIWQAEGQFYAWQDLCIHRGVKLSLGKVLGDTLRCPYHGWTYNHAGQCVHIPAHPDQTPPAKAQVKRYQIQARYGLLWVCLGEPKVDVPTLPEWEDSRFATAVFGPYAHLRAHGPRLVENFLDAAHFPFVHEGVLGTPDRTEIGEYEARIGPNGVESDPIFVYQPAPYGGEAGQVSYTYHAYRPLTAHFTKQMPNATNGMVLTVTPHDELDSSVWFLVATTAQRDSATLQRDYQARMQKIFEEDYAVVAAQRPELLPLDLQAELHLRSDRVAIAYRQWLRQLGLIFGTA